MSEPYYEKEDVVEETPRQAIENWKAESNRLANVVPEVAQALNAASVALRTLWDEAEARGDEGAKAQISLSWPKIEWIANQVVQEDALNQAAKEAITVINEERLKVSDMYDGLTEAIWDQDESHPELEGFAKAVRHDHEAKMLGEAEAVAQEVAVDMVYDELMKKVMTLTGCEWEQVNQFIAVLVGDAPVSNLNKALLKDWIENLK